MSLEHEIIQCRPRLFKFARKLCGNESDAEDLVQETMRKAWEAKHPPPVESDTGYWMVAILRHTYWNMCRNNSMRNRQFRMQYLYEERVGQESAMLQQEASIEFQQVYTALLKLEPIHSQVLIQTMIGSSHEEIARLLGVPKGTVKSRVNRAREKLNAILNASQVLH